jgi:hypothetical protein
VDLHYVCKNTNLFAHFFEMTFEIPNRHLQLATRQFSSKMITGLLGKISLSV